MTHKVAEKKLIEYLEDAHAMEENVLKMLDSMIATTKDPAILRDLEHHKHETEQHRERLEERLQARGTKASSHKDLATTAAALLKGMADSMRSDKPAKNARDGFATEHVEIATYEILERIAEQAGDDAAAEVARLNRKDEEAMAAKIATTWERVCELTLQEAEAA
jgi:ferritin-like metal-binding protein YciE